MPSGKPKPQTVKFSKENRCERRAHWSAKGTSASPLAWVRCSLMLAIHFSFGVTPKKPGPLKA